MKLKTAHSLIVSLILTVGHLTQGQAVTDAELEALEKQIEQQEVEEKQKVKAESEKQRLLEEKRLLEKQAEEMRKLEAERKRQEEEQKRVEEEKRHLEESKKRAEEQKKEKYTILIAEAEQAVSNKDKEIAISKYNEALVLYPNDQISISGISKAAELKEKVCYEVLGWWINDYIYTIAWNLKEDGSSEAIGKSPPSWDCYNPKKRQIRFKWGDFSRIYELSDDGLCLCQADVPIEKKKACITDYNPCYVRKGN